MILTSLNSKCDHLFSKLFPSVTHFTHSSGNYYNHYSYFFTCTLYRFFSSACLYLMIFLKEIKRSFHPLSNKTCRHWGWDTAQMAEWMLNPQAPHKLGVVVQTSNTNIPVEEARIRSSRPASAIWKVWGQSEVHKTYLKNIKKKIEIITLHSPL